MRASIAIALIATACRLVVAGSALACPPDPSSCTLGGPGIALEGADAGAPDKCSDGRCGDLTVTIRQFSGVAMAGSSVIIDFSGCPDVHVACDQLAAATGQSASSGHFVSGTTNAAGQFTFKVQGAATAAPPGSDTAPGVRAGVPCATVYADGVRIGGLIVAAYDVNGLGSPDAAVNAADVALVAAEALRVMQGGTPRARDDYNASGSVNSADVAISATMALQALNGTGSRTIGAFCP